MEDVHLSDTLRQRHGTSQHHVRTETEHNKAIYTRLRDEITMDDQAPKMALCALADCNTA